MTVHGITDSMDKSLRKLWEIVKDKHMAVHGVAKSQTQVSDKQTPPKIYPSFRGTTVITLPWSQFSLSALCHLVSFSIGVVLPNKLPTFCYLSQNLPSGWHKCQHSFSYGCHFGRYDYSQNTVLYTSRLLRDRLDINFSHHKN